MVGRARRGREGEGEVGVEGREPPACEVGFQTCDLPLLGMGLGEDGWEAPVLGEGFEADMTEWQAVAVGGGSLSSASPFGGVAYGAGLA